MRFLFLLLFVSGTLFSGVSANAMTAYVPQPGDLIKGDASPTLYYIGTDNKRYVFPNFKTYRSWRPDFSRVMIVPELYLSQNKLGGNVVYKSGERLLKVPSAPEVYAIECGALRWIPSKAVAEKFYGADWQKKIEDLPEAFFKDYTIGEELSLTSSFDPATAAKSCPLPGNQPVMP